MTPTRPTRRLQLPVQTSEMSAVFSPDRSRLLATDDRKSHIWDLETGTCLHTLAGHNAPVTALAWSADQHWVASGGHDDQNVRIWDAGSGACLRVLEGHRSYVRSVAFSQSREQLVSGSGDGIVRLWELSSGKLLQRFQGHTDGVYNAVFDAGHTRILSGSRDRTIRLWEVSTGHCLKVMTGSGFHIQCLAWHADQRRFLSCADDVRLWNSETGECLRVFHGHRGARTVAWSYDYRHVLSASHDRSVRIWDADTACCIQVFWGHEDCVVNAVWTLDRRFVISCDSSGGLRWWAIAGTPDSDDRDLFTRE